MRTLYALKSTTSIPTKITIVEPVQVLRGAGIAHMRLDPEEAVRGAASWLDGKLIVLPTITMACDVFGTYYKPVVAARGNGGNNPKTSLWLGLLARAWLCCGVEERVAFVRAYEQSIWAALERVVDHQD